MLSSLLAFASGLAAKVVLPIKRDPIDIEIIIRLQTELNDLRRDFGETLTRVERQRDEALALVERYQGRVDQQAPAGPVFGPVHHINEDMRQRMMAQAHAQAQQGWAQQGWAQQGLAQYALQQGQQLGMQNFGQALDDYVRNCTPGRHELFMRGP